MPNRFVNSGEILTTTSKSLYICPEDHQVSVHSLFFTNINTENEERFVTISVYDSSKDLEYFIGKNLSVPPNRTLSFDKSINLEENDILKAKADKNVEVHAFLSALLITPISI